MLFQILDANYTYGPDGFPVVQLFGPTEEGRSVVCRVSGFRPYFYAGVEEERLEEAIDGIEAMNLQVEVVDRFEPIGYQARPTKMLRIVGRDPKDVRILRERVREMPGIKAVYESDILFKNRYLIDSGLGGMGWAEAPGEKADITEVSRGRREVNAPLKHMAFDIECLPRGGEMPTADVSPVILISMAFKPAFQGLDDLVLVARELDCPRSDVLSFRDEAQMIAAFIGMIKEFDPDILAGYNSNEFDLPYLDERLRRLGLEARVGRDGSHWIIRKIVNQTNVAMTGRIVVDLLPIIRSSYSLKQYTLRNASSELLSMEKYDVDPKEIESIWMAGGDELRRFIRYSRRDAVLALRLLLDLRLMDKYIALSQASGSLLQDVVNGGQSGMVESLLLRRFRESDRVIPPKPDSEVSEVRHGDVELKGGAVLDPEKGLLEDVVILDYKSLYPTIMMAHNLCYSTVIIGPHPPGDAIRAPSGGEFVSPEVSAGIVPSVLRELLDQRTETKRMMKSAGDEERQFLDAKQYAMKILLNSFYGYSGYARARLYSLTLANAVTSFGRANIARTKELIEEISTISILDGRACLPSELEGMAGEGLRGLKEYNLSVVYGDTDSVFVRLQRRLGMVDDRGSDAAAISPEEAELVGKRIAQAITSWLPPPMELVFEAFARRAIFLAKKRYALWVFERLGANWQDRIKVRGMETVRRDWCELTSKTLNRCLELLLKEGLVDEAVDHVQGVIDRIGSLDLKKDRDMLDDLTLTRRYTKSPSAYKSKQPHIQLVEKMRRRGGRVPGIGDRIPFVIVKEGRRTLFVDRAEDPEYAVENEKQIDTDYYIEKQILPPVLRIFSTFNITKEQLRRDRRQRNLLDFGREAKPQTQRSLSDY